MTDFFGSVRNIELMNDTDAVSQERGEEEKKAKKPLPSTQKESVVQPVSAYQLTPQEFLVSERTKEVTAYYWSDTEVVLNHVDPIGLDIHSKQV